MRGCTKRVSVVCSGGGVRRGPGRHPAPVGADVPVRSIGLSIVSLPIHGGSATAVSGQERPTAVLAMIYGKRTSASSPACRRSPRGMEDPQNLDRIPRDTVRD